MTITSFAVFVGWFIKLENSVVVVFSDLLHIRHKLMVLLLE